MWRTEDLHCLGSSPNVIRVIKSRRLKRARHVARMRDRRRRAYGILVGKTEGKRPLERPRSRFEDNIKIIIA